MKRADPQRVEKSNHCGKERTYSWKEEHSQLQARTRTGQVQDKDQDEVKFKMSVDMGVMNCADNKGDKNVAIMTVKGIGGRLNKITVTRLDVMCMCFVKKGKLVLRKKVMSVVVICQRKSWHRKENISIYFEDNAGVIVNVKREMKGSAITRPVSQEHLGEVSRQVNMVVMEDRQGKEA